MRKFYAQDIMSTSVVCLNCVASVRNMVQVLEETKHNGFPLVDHQERYVGLILRSQLITLLQKKDFIEDPNVRIKESFIKRLLTKFRPLNLFINLLHELILKRIILDVFLLIVFLLKLKIFLCLLIYGLI